MHQLSLWRPDRKSDLTVYDVINYLDLASSMAHREPDGSVLKYAIKAIRAQKKRTDALLALISYTLNLSFHNPVLIPLVDQMFDEMVTRGYPLSYGDSILRLVSHYAESRSADALCWSLYFASRHGMTLGVESGEAVVGTADCCSLAMLRRVGDAATRQLVLQFATDLIAGVADEIDKYELDQYWLLLYELYLDGEIANPCVGEPAFEILQAAGIRFLT